MKIKILGILVYVFMAFAFSENNAFAQAGSRGGGLAYVCRDKRLKVTKAFLLDLKVEEFWYQRPLIDIDLCRDEVLSQLMRNVDQLFWNSERVKNDIMKGIAKIEDKIIFFPAGLFMQSDPKDYNIDVESIIYEGQLCPKEVLGLYDDKLDIIRVDWEIYDHLSDRDQLAFALHELFFKAGREAKILYDSNDGFRGKFIAVAGIDLSQSDFIRRLNADLFTNLSVPRNFKLIPEDPGEDARRRFSTIGRPVQCSWIGSKKYNILSYHHFVDLWSSHHSDVFEGCTDASNITVNNDGSKIRFDANIFEYGTELIPHVKGEFESKSILNDENIKVQGFDQLTCHVEDVFDKIKSTPTQAPSK